MALGVLFDEDYTVSRAAIIPYIVVKARAELSPTQTATKFMLREDVWKAAGVEDVTDKLRAIRLRLFGFNLIFHEVRSSLEVRSRAQGDARRFDEVTA